MITFTPRQENGLLALSIFGLTVPNSLFVYYSMFEFRTMLDALTNPVALIFIVEAFVLMFLIAFLIRQSGLRSPGWLAFILLSLAGSMMFSVPMFLWIASRRARRRDRI